MPEEGQDFVEAIQEQSRFAQKAAAEAAAAPLTLPQDDRSGQNQTRIQTGRSLDHDMGVILELNGKEAYSPLYEPDPNAEKKHKALQLRAMDSFGDPELEQIMENVETVSLFLADLPEKAPIAFQVTSESLNKNQIIVTQGGQVWEQDPGWSRFFGKYAGEPIFSRGGTIKDREGNKTESKYLKETALRAVRAITNRYSG